MRLDRTLVSVDKYILQGLRRVTLSKRRSADTSALKEEALPLNDLQVQLGRGGKFDQRHAQRRAGSPLHCRRATVQDVRSLNATTQHLRSTAARPVCIWRMDSISMTFASMSRRKRRWLFDGGTGQHAGRLAGCDGGRNPHLLMNRQGQLHFMAKRQVEEEGAEHVGGRDCFK